MFRLRLTPQAMADLKRLPAFFETKSAGAAASSRATIVAGLESLRELPERGRPGGTAGAREIVVPFGSGGYIVRYRVGAGEVVIANIIHTRERR